jgi:hypothetical protein
VIEKIGLTRLSPAAGIFVRCLAVASGALCLLAFKPGIPAELAKTPIKYIALIVIGGFNSSNTCNLARICAERVPTYHIADPDGLLSANEIRHKPVGRSQETTTGWLPPGDVTIGRPSAVGAEMSLKTARSSSVLPSSVSNGTFGKSGARFRPI